ncbi:hypothetical protein QN277_019324 [Acacia crassicarpa]|uniref:Uncharacterized protein n=1 Tax=Acacia crassicarpa TaxID=499986 RepID=A0AAE1MQ84_9FABA|nr:hypothetical protein QN277_019324 [Acacia crassicarpa]
MGTQHQSSKLKRGASPPKTTPASSSELVQTEQSAFANCSHCLQPWDTTIGRREGEEGGVVSGGETPHFNFRD